MSAKKVSHPTIKLDLLHPQSNPEKITSKLIRWLLTSGRYIFVFVEALVLVAFLSRFKLDADLAEKKDAIEQQVPYIQSLKSDEITIRNVHLKLSTLNSLIISQPDYSQIFESIATSTPTGVRILSLNLTSNVGKVKVQINAQSQTNSDMLSFISALKGNNLFSEINLANIGLDQNLISFSLSLNANSKSGDNL